MLKKSKFLKVGIKESSIIKNLPEEEIESANKEITLFKTAILNKDLDLLESILDDRNTYFDNKAKSEIMEFFMSQFEKEIPEEYKTDEVGLFYCKGCQPGNPSLMFHNGYWPIIFGFEDLKKSIMITFKNGLISDLTMCYRYCSSEKLHEIAKQN